MYPVIKRVFRMWEAWVASICLLMIVAAIAPQQLGVIAYKFVFITLGAVAGYWVHVWGFGHIGDTLEGANMQHAKWRRVVFMVGGMMAASLAA